MIKYGRPIPVIIAIFLPILLYLIYAISNSSPLFFADDFQLLNTVLWVQEVDGFWEKLAILMNQHNEHRILLPRLLTLLDYKIEGAINWKTLIVIGNLIWIGNLWFFWEGFRHFKWPVWMFIAIPFIFLQPQYIDNVTWSISILQQSVIIFWFSLLTYLCSKNRYNWAILVAIIATFTHGNGIFSFIIGIILALLDRNRRMALIWAAVWLIVIVIYFWNFVKGQNADFGKSFSDPVRLISSFFAFFGSLTRIRTSNVNAAVLLGAVLALILAVYLIPKLNTLRVKRMSLLSGFDKMLLGNILFLGITGTLVSVSRSWAGIETVLAPRYQHYAPYVLCWVYIVILSFLNTRSRNVVAGFFIVFAVLFNALSYFTYNSDIQYRKNWRVADESNWINHNIMLDYVGSLNRNIEETYQEVVAAGICKMNDNFRGIAQPDSAKAMPFDLNFSQETIRNEDASGSYQYRTQIIENDKLKGNTFIYLKSGDGVGYWLPTRRQHSGIMEFFKTGKLSKPGFKADFLTENFSAGIYRIGLYNDNKFTWTTQTLRL